MESNKKQLTHTDESGKARMVDVSGKPPMHRVARAKGVIKLQPGTMELIRLNQVSKGDVLGTARIAGIQAAKMTPNLIPLCHTLMLTHVAVDIELTNDGVHAFSMVGCTGSTGVEMEALTAVSAALLTVYDMCKAVDKEMVISDITLLEKTKTKL